MNNELNELYVGRNLRVTGNANNGVRIGYVYLILAVLDYNQNGTATFKVENVASGNIYEPELNHSDFDVFGLSQVDRDILLPKVVDTSDEKISFPTAEAVAEANGQVPYTDENISSADLRKAASALGIANSSKYVKADLLPLVNDAIAKADKPEKVSSIDVEPTAEEVAEMEAENFDKGDFDIKVRRTEAGASVAISGHITQAHSAIIRANVDALLVSINVFEDAKEISFHKMLEGMTEGSEGS